LRTFERRFEDFPGRKRHEHAGAVAQHAVTAMSPGAPRQAIKMENHMNRFIGMLIAALVTASGGSAMATPKYLLFTGYCDFLSGVTINGTTSFAVHNGVAACGFADLGVAIGTEGTLTGLPGKYLIYADNILDSESGTYSGASTYLAVQLPLKAGNSWFLYETTDGATVSYSNSGTYTLTNKEPKVEKAVMPSIIHGHSKLLPAR
jgi:hypothetical protein